MRAVRADSKTLIELSACSVRLEGRAVLAEIDFTLRAGERWALLGPNGAGKTLLLKLLRGDIWPTPTGRERRSYRFDGAIEHAPAGARRRIAYVGAERQDKYSRYGWNSRVREVVTTGLFDEDLLLTRPSRAQRARIERVLRQFGLMRLAERRMLTLSYGERRRALLARAFASPASVLLLDEVFNGLDAQARQHLQRALARPRGRHAWILTSHRLEELPAGVTHVALLEHGRMVAAGPLRSMRGLLEEHREASMRTHGLGRSSGRSARLRRSMRDASASTRARAREALISLRGATVYRDERPVIRALDWTLARGEHWAVLGANGAGKSTLLGLLYGDLHPALGGTIERRGLPRGEHIEAWKRRVGWVSPELQADQCCARSLEEIVVSGRYASCGLNAAPGAAERAAARHWLDFFGIGALRSRAPRQVSYGQMRLALLARAMVNAPQLLLLDEPCSGLDRNTRAHVLRHIERLARAGIQLVLATHDTGDLVPSINRLLRIGRDGRVMQARLPQAQSAALRRRSARNCAR